MQSRALTIISTFVLGSAAMFAACSDDGGGGVVANGGTGGQGGSAGSTSIAGSAGTAGGAGSSGSAGQSGSGNGGTGGSAGSAGSAGTSGSAGTGGTAGTGGDAGTHGQCDTFDYNGCISECEQTGAELGDGLGCSSQYSAMENCFATDNTWLCGDSPSHPQPANCGQEQADFGQCTVTSTGPGDGGTTDFSAVCTQVCNEEQTFQNSTGGDAGTVDAGLDGG